ncbi:MAG: cell division protein FtsA [Candidatus Eisenbacteria bacterium]
MTSRIAASLDVGTTKVYTVVAEVQSGGGLTVLGVGDQPCEGVERGMVVGLDATISAIHASIQQAEKMAGVGAKQVVAGISGEHVRSLNSSGVIGVARKDREITQADVERVLEAARAVAIPGDRELLHVLPRDFTVDEQRGISDPIGMTGVRLEAEVHMVTVQSTAMQNVLRAIDRAGVKVENLILQPLAAAEAVMTEDERGLGALLLDMGGGKTDLAVFERGAVRHTAAIGYGGRAVSHDLAIGLRTPLEEAERIKVRHGVALIARAGDGAVPVPGVGGREGRSVPAREIAEIIEARVEEVLSLCRAEVERVVDPELLAGGIVLTGGASLLPHVRDLCERVFGLPTRLGQSEAVAGVSDLAFDPRLSVAIGLLRYAEAPEESRGSLGVFGRVSRPVKDWIRAAFS